MDCKEPYRATKLWNEVILAFQTGMPIKKHRRRMHSYPNCFTAYEGVTWLHCYLMNNPNFGPDVTRQQSMNLIQKFLKCHVIESAIDKTKKSEFSDNSHLYRFTPVSPQQAKFLPLRHIQSPYQNCSNRNGKNESSKKKDVLKYPFEIQKENLPECHLVEKKLSLAEIKHLWEKVSLSKLEKLLPSTNIHDIVDEKMINGHNIKHNISRISKTGVVYLIDRTDDIPHWVISAMKCLANWPNARGSGSCLPNYPGFEKDVFKVVSDFFINAQVPLLSPSISSALLTIFGLLTQSNFDVTSDSYKLNWSVKASKSFSADVKTSTPVAVNNDFPALASKAGDAILEENGDAKLLLDDPAAMWDYPSAVYFETDFATSDPITRVVPDQCVSRIASSSYVHSFGSVESISTISICSQNQRANIWDENFVVNNTTIQSWKSDSHLQDKIKTPMNLPQKWARSSKLEIGTEALLTDSKLVLQKNESEFHGMPHIYSDGAVNLDTSVSSTKTLTENVQNMSFNDSKFCKVNEVMNFPFTLDSSHLSLAICTKSSSSPTNHRASEPMCRTQGNFMREKSYPQELKSSFQLVLLFLPPANRRQLHLLLRVLNKILKNGKFVLDVKTSMRDYLLETFLPAIVKSNLNQIFLLQMVSFLLDNCEALLMPPSGLKEEVEELIVSHNRRIRYSMDTCSLTYCELVSKQQYEDQKISMSAEALKSLLNNIVQDRNINEKERKKKLKQFKENHPDVFFLQFPEKQDHTSKPKKTFLNKLVNLRM